MAIQVCNVPGCPEVTTGPRFSRHSQEKDRRRGSSTERGYDARYRKVRAQVIREETHCWICGGAVDKSLRHPDPGSPSADHVTRRHDGGSGARSNLRLAHLGCNSARSRG